MSRKLDRSFFARKAEVVAQELVGKTIVHDDGHERVVGMITETGAYEGEGRKGLEVAPGELYIPVFQGGQLVLCIGTEAEGVKSVVTIRKLHPIQGMVASADGAAGVVAALHLDTSWTNRTICGKSPLWTEDAPMPPVARITPRQEKMAKNCNAYFRLGS